jgi:hypothetical protein
MTGNEEREAPHAAGGIPTARQTPTINPDTGRNVPQRDTSGQRVRARDPSALQQPTKRGIRDAASDDGGDDPDEDTEHDRRFESLGIRPPPAKAATIWSTPRPVIASPARKSVMEASSISGSGFAIEGR